MEEIMQMAKSPAGKKLIALLQTSNDPSLKQAKNAAEKGDYAQAKRNLEQIMQSPTIRKLLKEMGQ